MKKTPVIVVLCCLLLAGLAAYLYYAYFSKPPGFDSCYEEIAPPQPKSLALPPPPAIDIPDIVKAQAMALPDMPAIKAMPALRAEAARQKVGGSDALFKAVAAFHAHDFASMFTADDSRRQEARRFLLLLAGADKVLPGSRGPFMDAQELATMERFGGAHYLQLGEYPNPTPPASVHLADSFDKMLDVYFYMLAMTGPGQALYVPKSPELLDSFNVDISRKTLDQFITQADALTGEAEKRAYWLNALRLVKKDILAGNALLPELDASIRADIKDASLLSLLTDLDGGDDKSDDENVLTVNPGAFDPAKLAILRDKALALKTDKEKSIFWENVVRLARQGLANGWDEMVSSRNILELDKIIRETAPTENLKAIQTRVQSPVTQGEPYYTDADGHRTLVKAFYEKGKPGRKVCLKRVN